MIKMLVVDLDGTLLNHDDQISIENIKAIKKAQDLGVRFCIATGRPEQLVKSFVKTLNYEDDLIMYNGSVIGHPFKNERLLSYEIDKTYFKDLLDYGLNHQKVMLIYTKNAIFSEPNYRVDYFTSLNEELPLDQRAVFKRIIPHIDLLMNDEINKVLFVENNQDDYDHTMSRFSHMKELNFVRSQHYFIDINHHESSKGNAVEFLAKKWGIELKDVMVIGDQENDISMLKIAGKSVAVDNASSYVKSFCHHVVKPNHKNGVAEAIEKYILSEHMFKNKAI